MDLEQWGVELPDEDYYYFTAQVQNDEAVLAAQEAAQPWLFAPVPQFMSKLNYPPGPQLPLFSPSTPLLREELEVDRLARQDQVSMAIRTSVQVFEKNIPYIENYIRKTLGVTDPDQVNELVQFMYQQAVARQQGKIADAAGTAAVAVDLKEEQDAFDEFLLAIQPLATPEAIQANSKRVWDQTMAGFASWIDNAPKEFTAEELAEMQGLQAGRVEQAELEADNLAWEDTRARLEAERQASLRPGSGAWQIVGQWDEPVSWLEGDQVFTAYPQTRIAPADYQRISGRLPEGAAREQAALQHPWLRSGPMGEYTPVVPEGWAPAQVAPEVAPDLEIPTGEAPVQMGPEPYSAARKRNRWADHWKAPLPGQAEDGTITMHGGFGAVGGQRPPAPDFTGGLTPEEREAIRTINQGIRAGARTVCRSVAGGVGADVPRLGTRWLYLSSDVGRLAEVGD